MSKGTNIVGLDLNIDDDYLMECVKQTVVMGISEALNGKNEIVSHLVSSVLNTKCRPDGSISSYNSDNRYTLLQVYVEKAIRDVAEQEIAAEMEKARPRITKAIRKELERRETMDDMVASFVNGMTGSLANRWRPNIEISFERDDD